MADNDQYGVGDMKARSQQWKGRYDQQPSDGFRLKGQLSDNERAHPGKIGWKPRHGQDAIGKVK